MSGTGETAVKTAGGRVLRAALEFLQANPDGMPVSELKAKIAEKESGILPATIAQYLTDFATKGDQLRRLQRGVVGLADPVVGTAASGTLPDLDTSGLLTSDNAEQKAETAKEAPFYEPFANWLINEADEVNVAVPLGGGSLRGKWGTPDVIGVYKPKASDLIKFSTEIVSAEIKVDPNAAITAFGQAVSYRLFSHKTIIVMPDVIEKNGDANSRLQALCDLFGVGYVLFNRDNAQEPNFRLVLPPRRFEPDMYYVNEFASRLLTLNKAHFNRLFA